MFIIYNSIIFQCKDKIINKIENKIIEINIFLHIFIIKYFKFIFLLNFVY